MLLIEQIYEPTPRGKSTWTGSGILSILTNEKYKGDALLQKTYIANCITKKAVPKVNLKWLPVASKKWQRSSGE